MSILIVDDCEDTRTTLRLLLESRGYANIRGAGSGKEALAILGEETRSDWARQLDVILMDVNLGKAMNGIEATRLVKEKAPSTRVLILTMFTDPGTVAEAVKAGADGYLSKGASKEVVVQAIKDVAAGKSVLDPNVTEGIFGRIGGRDPQALTDRELTVLQELTHGKSTREVAEHIHVSEETVKTYLKQIFRKLAVHDRTEAVAEAFRRGLVH